MKKIVQVCCIIILVIVGYLEGCRYFEGYRLLFNDYEKDVSKDKSYWGGYIVGAEYKIINDVYIIDDRYISKTDASDLGTNFHSCVVLNSNEYIKVIKITEYRTTEYSCFRAYAEISSGEHKGRKYDIADISEYISRKEGALVLKPNNKYLEITK